MKILIGEIRCIAFRMQNRNNIDTLPVHIYAGSTFYSGLIEFINDTIVVSQGFLLLWEIILILSGNCFESISLDIKDNLSENDLDSWYSIYYFPIADGNLSIKANLCELKMDTHTIMGLEVISTTNNSIPLIVGDTILSINGYPIKCLSEDSILPFFAALQNRRLAVLRRKHPLEVVKDVFSVIPPRVLQTDWRLVRNRLILSKFYNVSRKEPSPPVSVSSRRKLVVAMRLAEQLGYRSLLSTLIQSWVRAEGIPIPVEASNSGCS